MSYDPCTRCGEPSYKGLCAKHSVSSQMDMLAFQIAENGWKRADEWLEEMRQGKILFAFKDEYTMTFPD